MSICAQAHDAPRRYDRRGEEVRGLASAAGSGSRLALFAPLELTLNVSQLPAHAREESCVQIYALCGRLVEVC